MISVSRCGILIGVLLLVACGTDRPTAPTPAPTAPPAQPLPTGEPVATYVFSGPLGHDVRSFTVRSQYLLYANGVFGLRYEASAHVYPGTYRQENATITFRFDGSWTDDRGIATGTLKGDLLELRYSDIMQHSDFEDAVYRRAH